MNKANPRSFIGPIAGYIVMAIGVLAIAAIAIPSQDRSLYFWYKCVWTEVLLLVAWSPWFVFSFGVPSSIRRGWAGVLPASGMALGTYAGASFLLMVLNPWSTRTEVAVQIGLAVILMILLLGLNSSRTGAMVGTEAVADPAHRPSSLAARLGACEESFRTRNAPTGANDLVEALKSLREAIQYSISTAGVVAESADYRDLAQQTDQLCSEILSAPSEKVGSLNLDEFRNRAASLQRRVGLVSASLKVGPA